MDQTLSKRVKVIYLIVALTVFSAMTFLSRYVALIELVWLKTALNGLINVFMGFVAFWFIRRTGMREDYGFKHLSSYLIGLGIAVVLQMLVGVLPALLGQSLVGGHQDFVLWRFIYQMFYYILIIGPMEELMFRVYVQGTLIELLPRWKWLGVLAASLLFGLWHIINGNLIQVLFTFLLGCAFGFSKYFIRNCRYAGVAVAHGVYDFLNVVTTILLVK